MSGDVALKSAARSSPCPRGEDRLTVTPNTPQHVQAPNGRPAGRTEMKGQAVAAISRPGPRRCLARDGDLLALKARLVADHSSGAALAGQAVTHCDA